MILLPFASAVALAAVPVVSWFQVGIFAVILPAVLVSVSLDVVKLAAVISLLERSVLVAYVEVMVFPLPSLVALVALEALPLRLALIVPGRFNVIAPLPSTLVAVPELVPSEIMMFLAVPHLLVVMSADPLKSVPLILRVF